MQASDNFPVVAFTLAHHPKSRSLAAMAHLGLDRWPLARTPGLRFWRLFGVGKGRVFNPRADFQRTALFTVWDSTVSLKQFEYSARVMRNMCERADEVWTVHMLPVRWHGRWSEQDPFAGISPASPPATGPWVILTRATIRPTKIFAFLKAVPAVSQQLLQQVDLINSVGVGEAPLLYQGTISLWRSLPAITAFAYGPDSHGDVIRQTRREQWYQEELFARFKPIDSWGTWDGIDPLR
jgi:hypothetical protein